MGTVGLHILLLSALGSALYCFGLIRFLPTSTDDLLIWDASWFDKIARNGYQEPTTKAFFPLFPLFWRLTGASPLGICFWNAGLFLAAFTWLAHALAIPRRWALVALASPSLFFMAVPYSEALFFAFGAMLLVGLHRRNTALLLVGLLGCSLTRAAATLFIPALLLTCILMLRTTERRRAIGWLVGGTLLLIASFGLIMAMHWKLSGDPLAYTKALKATWGRELGLPKLPFFTTGGVTSLWVDMLAIWVGLGCGGCCAWLGWKWLKSRPVSGDVPQAALSPATVFSLGYCFSVALVMLFVSRSDMANYARYTFATPFFVVLLWQLAQLPPWSARTYWLLGAAALSTILTLGFPNVPGFTPWQALWYVGLTVLYMLVVLRARQWRWGADALLLLYVFNLVMQLHFLDSFLQFYWIE